MIDLIRLEDNIYTQEDINLIIDKFKERNLQTYGELDPDYSDKVSLSKASHFFDKMWFENGILWANMKILNTEYGKFVKNIIGDVEDLSNMKAKNRDSKIDSIFDDDYEYEYLLASKILKEKGIKFCLRGRQVDGKLTNFFTFDIKTFNVNELES